MPYFLILTIANINIHFSRRRKNKNLKPNPTLMKNQG